MPGRTQNVAGDWPSETRLPQVFDKFFTIHYKERTPMQLALDTSAFAASEGLRQCKQELNG